LPDTWLPTATEITAEHVPETDLRAQLKSAADPLQQSFAGLMLQYASGDEMDLTHTLELFPIQLTPLRDYVAAQLGAVAKSA